MSKTKTTKFGEFRLAGVEPRFEIRRLRAQRVDGRGRCRECPLCLLEFPGDAVTFGHRLRNDQPGRLVADEKPGFNVALGSIR